MNSSLLESHSDRIGILICGHGSRNPKAIEEFANLALLLKSTIPKVPVEFGYLEFARPVLEEALEKLRAQSVERVIAIPAMLFAAGHAKNDIPSLLNDYSFRTGMKIDYGRELGVNSLMIGAAGERIKQAIQSASSFPLTETLLVVVGRGSSDPDANSNVSKIARMLVEGIGLGWGETVYSGVTFPLVEPGLRHLVRLGFKRIIVFPYFLFSGVLVSRVRRHTKNVAVDFPGIEFISADYLGCHPMVIQAFRERIEEVLEGNAFMNCLNCKYRSEVLGFEKEVGLAQQSHHHHVEGITDGCDLCTDECIGSCEMEEKANLSEPPNGHSHSHSHSPYPQAEHPLGPVTLPNSNNNQIGRKTD